jgi:hypothetical protein
VQQHAHDAQHIDQVRGCAEVGPVAQLILAFWKARKVIACLPGGFHVERIQARRDFCSWTPIPVSGQCFEAPARMAESRARVELVADSRAEYTPCLRQQPDADAAEASMHRLAGKLGLDGEFDEARRCRFRCGVMRRDARLQVEPSTQDLAQTARQPDHPGDHFHRIFRVRAQIEHRDRQLARAYERICASLLSAVDDKHVAAVTGPGLRLDGQLMGSQCIRGEPYAALVGAGQAGISEIDLHGC